MKWIFLTLIFLAGIYFIIHRKNVEQKEQEMQTAMVQEDLQYKQLPEKVTERYVLRLSPATRKILFEMTGDSEPKIRWAAVELLYRIEDPQATQMVKERLSQEPEAWIRKSILRMLGDRRDMQSLQLLGVGLKDYDKEVRLVAVETIGNFTNAEALPVLNKAMEDYDPEVKLKAIEALDRIQETLRAQKEEQIRKLKDSGMLETTPGSD